MKSIEKHTFVDFRSFTSMMKNRCHKGPQKSCFLIQYGDMVPHVLYSLIFDSLGVCPQNIIFDTCPMDQQIEQIEQIEPWNANLSKKCLRVFDGVKFLGGRCPQDQLKVVPFDHFDHRTIHKGSRRAVGPKARRI